MCVIFNIHKHYPPVQNLAVPLEWTGKILLIDLILAPIRMQDEIALAVASTGIASTLLVQNYNLGKNYTMDTAFILLAGDFR